MKRSKLIVILLTVAVCAVALALLAGCGTTRFTPETDHMVTLDYNIKKIKDEGATIPANCETQYLAVYDGSKIFAPNSGNSLKKPTITNYYNEGWYTAVLDEEGNPVKDEDGYIQLKDKWNFETDVVNQDVTLYANFVHNPTLTVVVEGGNNLVISQEPNTSYDRPKLSSNKPQREGYTFIDYYTDETYTTKFTFPYTFTDENTVCYALMLEGEWEIVKTVDNFIDALIYQSNMYFEAPNGVIDFAGRSPSGFMSNKEYDGKVYGNGCVIKNMTVEVNYSQSIKNYSLFGNLGSKAEIKDLTFENISLTVTLSLLANMDVTVSLFASNIAEGAKIENVSFANCSLTYAGRSYYEIEEHLYYVSGGENYDCFDETQLTFENKITKQDRT